MLNGFFVMPWWGFLVVAFLLTHITAIGISVYLHRHSAHRALDLHPAVKHFFRFWLWLTTGMSTRAWTAVHRKHHAKCETPEDPHSPQILGLKKVLLEGAELYKAACKDKETLTRYGQGTPDDWLENKLYTKHSTLGIFIMAVVNLVLFGPIGITIWALQMIWTPLCAAGIINGIGHYFGYRNFECKDASTNVFPFGFMIMGEELHNNHHTFATSAKFSVKPWEFDMGWFYIRLLSFFGLAKVKRLPPKLHTNPKKIQIDLETAKAIVSNRFQVMANYSKEVIYPVFKELKERSKISSKTFNSLVKNKTLMKKDDEKHIASALANCETLKTVYHFHEQLQNIWEKTTSTHKELVEALQEWCKNAENTGIKTLREFANSIKTYSLDPV